MTRAAIERDLEVLRAINVEQKALRARLRELALRKAHLNLASIARSHQVPLSAVQSIARGMGWSEEEKPPDAGLPPYDLRHAE